MCETGLNGGTEGGKGGEQTSFRVVVLVEEFDGVKVAWLPNIIAGTVRGNVVFVVFRRQAGFDWSGYRVATTAREQVQGIQ